MDNKTRSILRKFSECVDNFQESFNTLVRLFQNAGNIEQRLPFLKDENNYKNLGNETDLQQMVLAKQVTALENVKNRILNSVSDLETIVNQEERLFVDFSASVSSVSSGGVSSMDKVTTLLPESTTLASLVEAIENLWRLNRDQACQTAAAAAVALNTSADLNRNGLDGLKEREQNTVKALATPEEKRKVDRDSLTSLFNELGPLLQETASYAIPFERSYYILRTTVDSMTG